MKNLVAKTQCEITAELLDPELLGALLNSLNPTCKFKEGEGKSLLQLHKVCARTALTKQGCTGN